MAPLQRCPNCGEMDEYSKDAHGKYNCQKCGHGWKKPNPVIKKVIRCHGRRGYHSDGSVDLAPIGQSNIQDSIFGRRR